MTLPSAADLEKAKKIADEIIDIDGYHTLEIWRDRIIRYTSQALAEVRRETAEECARIAENEFNCADVPKAIRERFLK